MKSYVIAYWMIGKIGFYYTLASDRQKARENFLYEHPTRQILTIEEAQQRIY